MVRGAARWRFWAPRVLGLAFAAFTSIFAADAFGGVEGFWQGALALLLHLLPTFFVLAILAIAWRRERPGGILLLGQGG